VFAFGALLTLVVVLSWPAAGAFGGSSARPAQLTAAVAEEMERLSIPGAIVGVWQDGATPYVRAFGVRDKATGRPMRTDLRMRIGSETKTFTGTAVLQLVDKGKVGLDSPIDRYIDDVPNGDEITIRQLLEMRSGLPTYNQVAAWVRAAAADPHRQWTRRELLAYSFAEPALFAPGTSYHYSNTNTLLLGQVVRKVSGQPLTRYLRRHILDPLHLGHTSFPLGAAFPSPHAQGYTNFTPDCIESGDPDACATVNSTSWNFSWAWAAGGMVSTLGDLHRWARMVATGKLLSRATQRQRIRFREAEVEGVGYGLALADSHGWIGHDGVMFGWESTTIYLPSEKATVVVLVNGNNVLSHDTLADQLAQEITRIITPEHVYAPW